MIIPGCTFPSTGLKSLRQSKFKLASPSRGLPYVYRSHK